MLSRTYQQHTSQVLQGIQELLISSTCRRWPGAKKSGKACGPKTKGGHNQLFCVALSGVQVASPRKPPGMARLGSAFSSGFSVVPIVIVILTFQGFKGCLAYPTGAEYAVAKPNNCCPRAFLSVKCCQRVLICVVVKGSAI